MSSDGKGMLNSPTFIKGVSSVVIASIADKFVLGIDNNMENVKFGAAVGAGIAIGNMIGSQVPSVIQDTEYYNGKTIAQRSFEVIFGTAGSYALMYASKSNSLNYGDFYTRFGVVVATDFVSEYITDYYIGNQLSFLS
jgi:hypothetical protein